MKEIIAIVNQKGGVGKTTTAINLASALVQEKYKVCLIDLDPQGNCATGLGIDSTIQKVVISDALLDFKLATQSIVPTKIQNLFLVCSNIKLSTLESNIKRVKDKDIIFTLKEFLDLPSFDEYDYIIIDCPPSLGFLSLSAMTAADSLIIPVQCEYFALDAIGQVLATINQVQKNYNPDLTILGFLLTMFDPRTSLSTDITMQVNKAFREKTFKTQIPRNIYISEGCFKGMPVNIFKPKAQGALAYNQLGREVINYVKLKQRKKK